MVTFEGCSRYLVAPPGTLDWDLALIFLVIQCVFFFFFKKKKKNVTSRCRVVSKLRCHFLAVATPVSVAEKWEKRWRAV